MIRYCLLEVLMHKKYNYNTQITRSLNIDQYVIHFNVGTNIL